MGTLKLVSGALAVLAVSLLVVGGAGFSQVSAERGVEIAVVNDSEAYVGYQAEDHSVTGEDTKTLVTVTNRLPSEIDVVDVQVAGDEELAVDLEEYPRGIDPGDEGHIRAGLSCDEAVDTTLSVTVSVAGEGVEANIYGETRSFDVECEPPEPEVTAVTFEGSGNAHVYPTGQQLDLGVWVFENGSLEHLETTTINTSESIRGNLGTGEMQIVAVSVPSDGVTYYHPGFDYRNETLPAGAPGGDGVRVAGSP
jgi:hypothetical protein